MKKLFQNPVFKNVIGPFIRSTTKTLCPPAGTAIEIIKNLIATKEQKKPHSWTSIGMQVIIWGIILYAFGTKMITIDDAFNYLQGFAPADTLK